MGPVRPRFAGFLLLLSACVAPTVQTPASQTATTDPDSCSESVRLICETVDLIEANHVDDPSLTALGEAAERGIDEFATAGSADWEDCRIPLDGFEGLCPLLTTKRPSPTGGVEAALLGMTSFALDQFSVYLDPTTLDLIRQDQAGQVEGIGAVVSVEPNDPDQPPCLLLSLECRLVIVSTIADSPAERVGILPDDVVVTVDGVSVDGKTIDQVTGEVRGEPGTEVLLGVLRGSEDLTFEVTRSKIEIPVVETALVGDVGYLRLNMFTANSARQVDDALESLLAGGAGRLVFDLRDNPGGTLVSSIEIASEFVDAGPIVSTVSRRGTSEYPADGEGRAVGIPTIVLVNGGSASASEVVAGALQDAGAAVVAGETTFGKTSVQQSYDLSNGGALKLTIARWVTRQGRSLDGGVIPDHPLDFRDDPTPERLVEMVADLWPEQ